MRKLIAAAMLGLSLTTVAEAVTVSLSTKIEEIGQNYFGGGVVDLFAIGDVVNFSFNYVPDDTVPEGDHNGMKYVVTEFTLSIAAYTATIFNRGAVKFTHGEGYDGFSVSSGNDDLTQGYGIPLPGVPLLNGYYLSSFAFHLESFDGGAFTSDSMNQPLFASDFEVLNSHFAFREPVTTRAMGTMQSRQLLSLTSTLNPIPEPGTVGLFALGLLALLLRLQRARL